MSEPERIDHLKMQMEFDRRYNACKERMYALAQTGRHPETWTDEEVADFIPYDIVREIDVIFERVRIPLELSRDGLWNQAWGDALTVSRRAGVKRDLALSQREKHGRIVLESGKVLA
jgi:hypothetical protein